MATLILHLVFFISGFTALGFQLMWTRVFSIGIGNELASVLAVVSAFFGGLTLGAWLLDKPIARSGHPGKWYAALEGSIGIWGALTVFAIPFANRMIFRWTGLESPDLWRWTVCFLVPFLTLLPATFCMGGTLPAMERAVAGFTSDHRPIPGLYSANTLGAMFGTFAAVFAISPRLGYRASTLFFAGMALFASLSAFLLARRSPTAGRSGSKNLLLPARFDRVSAALFFTGLLGIGYEVVCTRALSQYFEDSVYTYSCLLMVYLLGTASGAFCYKKWLSQGDSGVTAGILLAALAFSCLLGADLIPAAGPVNQSLWKALGQGPIAQSAGEIAASALVFFVPTLCMGATFSHLGQAAKENSLGLGRALAINTLGGALAPFLFGILLVPAVGIRATLIALGLAYLALIRPSRILVYGLAAASLPLLAAAILPWNLVTLPPGFKLLEYREGAMSSVAVLEDESGGKSLKVDNRFNMGGTHSEATERIKTHLPLLLHPDPRKALFIGLGTGITFGTAADYPSVSADGVELDPLVVAALPDFAPYNRFPFGGTHRIYTADARRYVRATGSAYDVILADFFHPDRDGAATLYTLEHFQAIRSRLGPGGIFCQWLPLYQLDMLSLRMIIRTFLQAFPHSRAYLGNFSADLPGLALIGSEADRAYPDGWFAKRVTDQGLREMLAKEGLSEGLKASAFYFASQRDLEAVAGDAPLNLDDLPRVMYTNPGFEGLRDYTSFGRLESLLDICRHEPALLAGAEGDSASRRYREDLGKVLVARDLYLRGAIAEAKGDREGALGLYLRSAGTTGLFTVGYAKCLMIAIERRESEPEWTQGLLRRLEELRPDIEDAHTLRKEMFPEESGPPKG